MTLLRRPAFFVLVAFGGVLYFAAAFSDAVDRAAGRYLDFLIGVEERWGFR